MATTTIIILILTFVCIILAWTTFNLSRKVNIYEKYISVYNQVFLDLVRRIKATDDQLKIIDSRGTFEADDEVGFFFLELKKIQIILNEFIENIQTLTIFK